MPGNKEYSAGCLACGPHLRCLSSGFDFCATCTVLHIYRPSALCCRCFVSVQYLRREHLTDVTEIFRQVSVRKRREMLKLAFYLVTFVLAIYK